MNRKTILLPAANGAVARRYPGSSQFSQRAGGGVTGWLGVIRFAHIADARLQRRRIPLLVTNTNT